MDFLVWFVRHRKEFHPLLGNQRAFRLLISGSLRGWMGGLWGILGGRSRVIDKVMENRDLRALHTTGQRRWTLGLGPFYLKMLAPEDLRMRANYAAYMDITRSREILWMILTGLDDEYEDLVGAPVWRVRPVEADLMVYMKTEGVLQERAENLLLQLIEG